jgi:hypothetical protein
VPASENAGTHARSVIAESCCSGSERTLTARICDDYESRDRFFRDARARATPPTANDARPKIGPVFEPPVNGSNPVGLLLAVTLESEVGVEFAVTGVDVGDVEPWVPTVPPVVEVVEPPIDVLVSPLIVVDVVEVSPSIVVDVVEVAPAIVVDVVEVAPSIVVDVVVVPPPIVVVVPPPIVVDVVVVGPEHCDESVTAVVRVAVAPSVQVAWTVSVTVPVEPPGTVVVADVDPSFATLGV